MKTISTTSPRPIIEDYLIAKDWDSQEALAGLDDAALLDTLINYLVRRSEQGYGELDVAWIRRNCRIDRGEWGDYLREVIANTYSSPVEISDDLWKEVLERVYWQNVDR